VVSRYRQRVSGPLLDRFDLVVKVDRLEASDVSGPDPDSTRSVRERVVAAHARLVEDYPTLSGQAESLLATALDSSLLTGRGVDRVRRVAASICALAGDGAVTEEHVAEAIGLRGEW
jgi:magnesium chelatase family protein